MAPATSLGGRSLGRWLTPCQPCNADHGSFVHRHALAVSVIEGLSFVVSALGSDTFLCAEAVEV